MRPPPNNCRFAIDRHLHDGDVLASGRDPKWQLRCIHTPGHDPGHLCFFEESTGALLAGDMVANPGTILVSREYAGDMAAFMHSLRAIASGGLQADHSRSRPAGGKPARVSQGTPGSSPVARRKGQAAHAEGAATFDELLSRAYDDAAVEAIPWARHSLDAHLAKLGIEMPAKL